MSSPRPKAGPAIGAFGPLEAWIFLKQTILSLERHASASLKPQGLTSGQMDVLLSLTEEEAGAGCPISTIADRLGVSRADLTGVVDNLCRSQAAKRELIREDRRLRILRLTPKGLELRKALRPGYELILREGLGVLATQAAVGYLWSLAGSRETRRTSKT